jgi:hypothetical protein
MCQMYNDYGSVARDQAEDSPNVGTTPETNAPQQETEEKCCTGIAMQALYILASSNNYNN